MRKRWLKGNRGAYGCHGNSLDNSSNIHGKRKTETCKSAARHPCKFSWLHFSDGARRELLKDISANEYFLHRAIFPLGACTAMAWKLQRWTTVCHQATKNNKYILNVRHARAARGDHRSAKKYSFERRKSSSAVRDARVVGGVAFKPFTNNPTGRDAKLNNKAGCAA
jgi:hypothetical protein